MLRHKFSSAEGAETPAEFLDVPVDINRLSWSLKKA